MTALTRRLLSGGLALTFLWASAETQAQAAPKEGFRLERLAKAPTPSDGFALTLPQTLGMWRWSGAVSMGYGLDPFVLKGPPERSLVSHRLAADVVAAVGVLDLLDVYARVPFVLVSAGDGATFADTTLSSPGGFSIGDMALGARARFLRFEGLSLGARAEGLLPTGNQDELNGDYAIAPRGRLLVSYDVWKVTLGAEGGAVYRPDRDFGPVRIGSEAEWVLGARFKALEVLDVWAESFGTRALRRPDGAAALDTVDVLIGARHRAPVGSLLLFSSGAIGAGFSDAAGDPSLRVLFNVAITSGEKPAQAPATQVALAVGDDDQDGIADDRDRCLTEAEDRDGDQDEDGCPDADKEPTAPPQEPPPVVPPPQEADTDGDTLLDSQDACPDIKGLTDHEGCLAHARITADQIKLLTPIVFDKKRGTFEDGAAPVLDDVATLLSARPNLNATVVAHVGEARGNVSARMVLTQVRADTIVDALVERGISADRLLAEGKGDTEPPADGQRKDRIEILLKEAPPPAPAKPAEASPAAPETPAAPAPATTGAEPKKP